MALAVARGRGCCGRGGEPPPRARAAAEGLGREECLGLPRSTSGTSAAAAARPAAAVVATVAAAGSVGRRGRRCHQPSRRKLRCEWTGLPNAGCWLVVRATASDAPSSVLEESVVEVGSNAKDRVLRRQESSMEAPVGFVAWPITARKEMRRRQKKLAKKRKSEAEAEEEEEEEAEEETGLPEEEEGPEEREEEAFRTDIGEDVTFSMEADLDRGLREEAAWLPSSEVMDSDREGNQFINRTKVIEALLKRKRCRDVWDRLPLDSAPWECKDCPNPQGEQVPTLAYGLESIVGMRGKIVPLALMPLEVRRGLRLVQQPEDLDLGSLPVFVPPWRDSRLRKLALGSACRFFSSTSSLTGLLSKCYFAISRHYGVELAGLSPKYQKQHSTHGPSTRWPTIVYLRRTACGQAWSITAAPSDLDEEEEGNVLMQLGLTMEMQVKMTKEAFDARYGRHREQATEASGNVEEDEEEAQSYRFLEVGPFMMRSQLDARNKDLIFDLKTRAVAPIRYNIANYKEKRDYRLGKLLGNRRSYEQEIYDMMRLAFLKYGLQARIGRMDGIFVTYHNTVEVFGFQYIPLADMDRCIYGGRKSALAAFDLSCKTLAELLRLLTEDADLARTGTIKVMLVSDPLAAGTDGTTGSTLDVSAAPVHNADTDAERMDAVRRWRVSLDVEGPDGKPRPGGEPLKEDLRVHLTAKELIFRNSEQARNTSSPWGNIMDVFRRAVWGD